MDMKETEVIHIAIENLKETAQIEGQWDFITETRLDGKLTLFINDVTITFNTEIKKELRNHQLLQLEQMAKQFPPFLIVAERIFPKIKEQLRQQKIAYLEANGNIYFNENRFHYFIDTQKPIKQKKEALNRAFTKTGLKVLFHFLLNNELVNEPHREIGEITQVAHGNIAYILNGLKENGFLVQLNKNTLQLNNKKELLEKWMAAYMETLKPTLEIGRFHFANEDNFNNWRKIQLNDDKTRWGGEPAGDLLTNYLRPGELTLYTEENRTDLMKNYRLIPDKEGDVLVYKKFWNDTFNKEANAVPVLLIYTDLINTANSRCHETAQMIWDKYLANEF
jgi:hypothetical protein